MTATAYKQNLILTYASGAPIFDDPCFWVFVRSLGKVPTADCVVLTHEMPGDARGRLSWAGVKVVDIEAKDMHFLYRDRHLSFYRYLNEYGHHYDHVLVTDCRDVVFQSNPFYWVPVWRDRYAAVRGPKRFLSHFVVLVAEGFKRAQSGFACIEQFEFQRDVPRPYMQDDHNRWVVNGGTFLGTPRALQDWHFLVWTVTMKSIGRCTDQATVNWLLHYLEHDDTYQITFPQHDHLCLTGEGVKEGAVVPRVAQGLACSPAGPMYHMVHQWDRVPDLKEQVLARYAG